MQQIPAQCNIGEYGPLPQQQSCIPCPWSLVVGASVCSVRRRSLLAADGSVKAARPEAALADASKGGVIGMATAAGYAACTLGVLALTGMASRRTTVVQRLKMDSAVEHDADAAAAAALPKD